MRRPSRRRRGALMETSSAGTVSRPCCSSVESRLDQIPSGQQLISHDSIIRVLGLLSPNHGVVGGKAQFTGGGYQACGKLDAVGSDPVHVLARRRRILERRAMLPRGCGSIVVLATIFSCVAWPQRILPPPGL